MSAPTWRTLLVEEHDDRVQVTLHRPDARNAIDREMVEELHAVLDDLERRPRFLVLTGGVEGTFAGGADIAQLLARKKRDALEGVNINVFNRLARAPMPTVAAIDGHALGGGAELAYACDVRLASPRTTFGQPEPRLGIIAGAGATWRLARLVGEPLAKEMLYTGRTLDADAAFACRLVAQVVPPGELLAAAHAVVDRMAKLSPLALRLSKLCVDAPPEAHPTVELLAQAVLFEDDEKARRMQAFLDRST